MPIVMKSGKLNFLETSGPVQACNGDAFREVAYFKKQHVCRIYVCEKKNVSAKFIFQYVAIFELVTFLHIRQTCLGFVDFRHNLL